MPRRRTTTIVASPYQRMYDYVAAYQRSRPELFLGYITSVLAGVLVVGYSLNQGWVYALPAGIFGAVVCFGFERCFYLTWRGLGYGTPEDKLVSAGLTFLHIEQLSEPALESIKARAEIGSTVSPVRSLIPILTIPIAVSTLNSLSNVSLIGWLFIGLGVLSLLFPLAIDLYKSSIDGSLRHAIAEYQYQQDTIISNVQNQELLEKLLIADPDCRPTSRPSLTALLRRF